MPRIEVRLGFSPHAAPRTWNHEAKTVSPGWLALGLLVGTDQALVAISPEDGKVRWKRDDSGAWSFPRATRA